MSEPATDRLGPAGEQLLAEVRAALAAASALPAPEVPAALEQVHARLQSAWEDAADAVSDAAGRVG